MTATVPGRDLDIEFSLPGEWVSLELRGGDEAVERRIRRMVADITGPRDEFAQVRHELRAQLTAVAQQASEIKADQVHLARRLVADVPFPVSLTISRPGISLPHAADTAAARAQLLEMVPGDEPVPVEHPLLPIVRSIDRTGSADDSSDPFHLSVNYWIQLTDDRTCIFTFNAALAGLDAQLLVLFDAIIQSVSVRGAAAGHV
jgi:hypothetical protein